MGQTEGDMGYQLTVNQAKLEALQGKFEPEPDPGQLGAEAFALLDWAVDQIQQGRTIYSCDGAGRHREVYTTGCLERVK